MTAEGRDAFASDPYAFRDLVQHGAINGFRAVAAHTQKNTMLEPVGGMDRIARGFEREIGHPIHSEHVVKEIRQSDDGVRVVVENADTGKAGLQFARRFWVEDDFIYGGHSTTIVFGNITYPSYGWQGDTGVVLGYYDFAWAALLAPAFAADGPEIDRMRCAQCHQPDGAGLGTFPALAGSEIVLGDPDALVACVLDGRGAMPAFRAVLDDEERSVVLSHVRTSFGNEAEPVEAELVAEVRTETGAEVEAEPVQVDPPDDGFAEGEAFYLANCSACHQPAGGGVPGTRLRRGASPRRHDRATLRLCGPVGATSLRGRVVWRPRATRA